jgi:hypothetical protein
MDEEDIIWELDVPFWDEQDYWDQPPLTPPCGGLSAIEGDEADPWDY